MSSLRKKNYFQLYSAKFKRAMKAKRHEEALTSAIKGYLISRDIRDEAVEAAHLAYMFMAVQALLKKSGKEMRNLDKKDRRCSFCGRKENEVRLMAGAAGSICKICTARIHRFFSKE